MLSKNQVQLIYDQKDFFAKFGVSFTDAMDEIIAIMDESGVSFGVALEDYKNDLIEFEPVFA